jgi:nucleotide-binding universal stress UspA family protein
VAELPRYQKILLATDGSAQVEPATRHAIALARQLGAVLEVVSVADTHIAFNLGIYRDEAIREMRQDARQALAAVAEQARAADVRCETHPHEGRPGEVIVSQAESLSADLIVVGSHGQGALGDILLGSVSQYVVHHADVPVCVVRPPRKTEAH